MNDQERHRKERDARRRVSAQRMRAGFLRGRVVAASILCFGLLWAVVFIQMATGNDPVLSPKARASAATRKEKRHRSAATRAATEAVGTSEPRELEDERNEGRAEAEAVEEPKAEVVEEPEPEVAEEPEAELEPLTTGQS